MIPYAITKKVIEATDIVEVISEYVPLKKKGTSYFGLCPFHDDKNPSMSVSGEKKIFNCFSCGTKGNVIYFVAHHDNLTMEQATIKLAKRAGIEINLTTNEFDKTNSRYLNIMNECYNFYRFYLYSSDEGKIALAYLYNRGINDEMIKTYKIGLAPKAYDYLHQALTKKEITNLDQMELGLVKTNSTNNTLYDVFRGRIMFAITNAAGQIVGFSGRIYEKSDQAKYMNSTDNVLFHKGEILYNYDHAYLEAQKLKQMFICEGFMDTYAFEKVGIKNVVATMGTAMTQEHVKMLLKASNNIVLFFDGDEAGIKALKRSTLMLSKVNVIPNAIVLPDNLDPDEYINKYGKDNFLSFIQNNLKNAYLVLYELAFKDVYLQDFTSVENFKKQVYEIINIANNETITNYFINRLSEDLKTDEATIRKNVINNLHNYETINQIYHQDDNQTNEFNQNINTDIIPRQIKKKTVRITKRLIDAYNTIIKQSINSKDKFCLFLEKTITNDLLRYPGTKLLEQFNMLEIINRYYCENELAEGIGYDLFIELIKSNKDSLSLGEQIINNRFIEEQNDKQFEECLQIIVNHFIEEDNINIYNEAINGKTLEEIAEKGQIFVELNKSQKKITKIENDI